MPSIAQPVRPVTSADLKRVMPDELPDGAARAAASAGARMFTLKREAMPPHADGFVWDEDDIPLVIVVADDLDPVRFSNVADLAIRAWFHTGRNEYRDMTSGVKAIGIRTEGGAR